MPPFAIRWAIPPWAIPEEESDATREDDAGWRTCRAILLAVPIGAILWGLGFLLIWSRY
jgi:hypothetical protein